MILSLVYYGNPLLRQKAARVDLITDEIRQLVIDMEETMFAHDGIGLAAPQIGRSLALFVRSIPIKKGDEQWEQGPTEIFINPKILGFSPEQEYIGEGCLSMPNIYGEVPRPVRIKVEATDINGNLFVKEYSDLYARNILHENDHLNGVLFIDRMEKEERKELENALRQLKKKYTGK